MPFVLDHSVVSGWYLESQASACTESIAERLQADRAWVPPVRELELANVLRSACVRHRMTAEAAHAVVSRIMSLPIDVDRRPAREPVQHGRDRVVRAGQAPGHADAVGKSTTGFGATPIQRRPMTLQRAKLLRQKLSGFFTPRAGSS